VVQLTAVRQRSCPSCERPVAARSARWCGSCGAPLRPVAAADDRVEGAAAHPGRARRVAVIVLAGAVVAALLLAGGPIIDRLPGEGAAVENLEVAAPSARVLDRVARRFQPPPPPLVEPVCLRQAGRDCFRWTVADADVGRSHVQVAGDLLLSTEPLDGEVTARRLSDGGIAWRASLGPDAAVDRGVTDELLLSSSSGVLTARNLTDGVVRWRSDELPAGVTFLAGVQRGSTVVVLVISDEPLPDGATVGPMGTAIGLDAADGRTRWRTDALGPAGIGSDATVVFVDDGGDLVALEPDGTERWRVPAVLPGAPGGAWVSNGVVTVYGDDDGGDRLYRLTDGQRLDLGGTVLAEDDGRVLLEIWPGQRSDGEGADLDAGPTYALLDADGEVRWEVAADPVGCTFGAEIDGAVVRVAGCGGAEMVLDTDDGQVLSRTPPSQANDGLVVTFAGRVGPYLLQPQEPSDAASAYLVVDAHTELQVARLPPDSVALSREGDAAWSHDLGGIAVIQHRGGLVALDLPGEGTRPDRPTGSVTSR
jgi:outer membrane protein assembly factor BamB